MKTVNRRAEVGEKIIITNAHKNYDDYENGDVFTVFERQDDKFGSGILTNEKIDFGSFEDRIYIYDHEYEVIV